MKLTYEESTKDIYEMIQKLKLDKPVIVGFSGGASVALHLAIKNELNSIKATTFIINDGRKDIIPVSEAEYLVENIKKSKILILEYG